MNTASIILLAATVYPLMYSADPETMIKIGAKRAAQICELYEETAKSPKRLPQICTRYDQIQQCTPLELLDLYKYPRFYQQKEWAMTALATQLATVTVKRITHLRDGGMLKMSQIIPRWHFLCPNEIKDEAAVRILQNIVDIDMSQQDKNNCILTTGIENGLLLRPHIRDLYRNTSGSNNFITDIRFIDGVTIKEHVPVADVSFEDLVTTLYDILIPSYQQLNADSPEY